jgi:hypothetical protein
MNKLIWQLFEMIRELLPPSADNTRRLAEWAQQFHLEAKAEDPEPPFEPDQEHELAELDDEDPPVRGKRKRR